MLELDKDGKKVELTTASKIVVTGAILFALAVIVVGSVWFGGMLATVTT